MPAKYVPGVGVVSSYDQQEEERAGIATPTNPVGIERGMSQFDYMNQLDLQQRNEERDFLLNNQPIEPPKPFISGDTPKDVLQAFPNALVGVATDILDLGAGVGDLAREGYRRVTEGDQYEFNRGDLLFNDSDNPWTQWRRDNMGTSDTYAGEFASIGLRIASLALPFNWIQGQKWARLPGQLTRIGQLVGKVRKPYQTAKQIDRISDVASGAQKASGIARASGMVLKNPYLTASYKDVAKIPELGNWMKRTQIAVQQTFKTKTKLRNLAETAAFDVVAGFMIFGEGDESLDETVFDFAASLGINIPLGAQTTIQDTALERKLKGMFDGVLVGTIGGALVDVFRLRRYADALKRATPAQKRQLLKALREEAEQLGDSVVTLAEKRFMRADPTVQNSPVQRALGQMADGVDGTSPQSRLNDQAVDGFAKAQPADLPQAPAGIPDPFLYDRNPLPPSTPGGALYLDTLVNQVERAREKIASDIAAEGAERSNRLTKQGAAGFVRREGQPQLEGTTTPGRAPTDSTPLSRAPMPDRSMGIEPARVQVLGQSNVEPTVTPQTIRRAVADAMAQGMLPEDIRSKVKRLMPELRVNQIDFLQEFGISPQVTPQTIRSGLNQNALRNPEGVIPASTSIWFNEILERGLREGWIQLDGDFNTTISRKLALDLDQSDLSLRAALNLDQAQDAKRYEQFLMDSEPMNPGSGRPEVQGDLQAKDAAVAANEPPADDAFRQGIRQADQAAAASQALTDEQLARMADEITAGADPDDLLADGLSMRAADVPTYDVQKVGRKYQVVDPNGEPIENGVYTTKKQAAKRIERENALVKEGLVKRAQQQLIDGDYQRLNWDAPPVRRDGDLTAKVSLSEGQAKAIQEYLTGDASGLLDGKRTLELPQGQLNEIAGDIRARLQQDGLDANQARVLKNLADKIDRAVESVAPAARRQRLIDETVKGVNRYLTHGDYC